jgi:hypothetical protein
MGITFASVAGIAQVAIGALDLCAWLGDYLCPDRCCTEDLSSHPRLTQGCSQLLTPTCRNTDCGSQPPNLRAGKALRCSKSDERLE